MAYPISVIIGDGIGCEVVPAALHVLEATGVKFEWDYVLAGEQAYQKFGDPLPEATLDSIRKNQIALKGPLTNFVAKGYPGPNRGLRNRLDLYAAVKRAKCYEGVESRYPGVDLVVIREVREDTYAGAEQQVGPGAAVALKFITADNSRKVARFAMDFAVAHKRKKVTATAKATALKLTDGLFYQSAQQVAKEYPQIAFDYLQVDNMAYQLVRNPWEQDVILAPNVYGDILADLISGLAGSLGLGFGGNFGERVAMFEAVHGTAPKYAGLDVANPLGEILSGAMLLQHIGESSAAQAVFEAVETVLRKGEVKTRDLGGSAGLSQMEQAVIDTIKRQ